MSAAAAAASKRGRWDSESESDSSLSSSSGDKKKNIHKKKKKIGGGGGEGDSEVNATVTAVKVHRDPALALDSEGGGDCWGQQQQQHQRQQIGSEYATSTSSSSSSLISSYQSPQATSVAFSSSSSSSSGGFINSDHNSSIMISTGGGGVGGDDFVDTSSLIISKASSSSVEPLSTSASSYALDSVSKSNINNSNSCSSSNSNSSNCNSSSDFDSKGETDDNTSPLFYGCRSVDEYQRLSFIDQGTYGAVFRAKCLHTGKTVALKQVKLDANAAYMGFPIAALREINILMALSHPHIISVVEMVVGASVDKVFMVMDYYDNDLKYCMSQKRHPFSLGDVKQLMLQLLSAVEHMHSKWYLHRDLKTSNILYSNTGKLCICDFGLARKYSSPIAPYTHEVVSLYYRAPEVLLGCEVYSTPLDMWAVACIFAELITGDVLFQGEGEVDQIHKIYRRLGIPSDEIWPDFSSLPGANKSIQYKLGKREKLQDLFPITSFSGSPYLNESGFDLLSKMLVYDPKKRLTASSALNHRWLNGETPNPTAIKDMPKFPSRHEES